ncbi:MAG: hypothetical protein ACTTID_00980 [Bacillales bacterium]
MSKLLYKVKNDNNFSNKSRSRSKMFYKLVNQFVAVIDPNTFNL